MTKKGERRKWTLDNCVRLLAFIFYFLLSPHAVLSAANVELSPLSAVKVYPNPWRVDKHQTMPIKFEGIPANSVIKLFTASAQEVKVLTVDANGMASWDRTNASGDSIASGVYIYLIIDPQGNESSGKLAVIK